MRLAGKSRRRRLTHSPGRHLYSIAALSNGASGCSTHCSWLSPRGGGRPEVSGHKAREITIGIHQTAVALALDRPKVAGREWGHDRSPKGGKPEPLRLAIVARYERGEERTAWQDGEKAPLERAISAIAVEIFTTAELNYRQDCVRQLEWCVQRKAQLEEERRQRKLELERQERERQQRLEQASTG